MPRASGHNRISPVIFQNERAPLPIDKKSLSERDICTKFITPALEAAGWDRSSQFLEEVNLTSGRVVVRGNKAKRDDKTCKLVVLDRTINSMTEFKQIIGRGTRIDEDYGKLWFTILDFKKATELFADPAFDGEPVVIYQPGPEEPVAPPEDIEPPPDGDAPAGDGDAIGDPPVGPGRPRHIIKDVPVYVVNERVQYYGNDGKLITESLKDYTRIQIGKRFASLDSFLQTWNDAEKKQAIIAELEAEGILFDELEKEAGKALDPFDLICHIAFGQKPLTRRERAERVRKRDYFTRHAGQARKVLEALLDKYADEGVANIEQMDVLRIAPLDRFGSPVEIVQAFGGRAQYQAAIRELEKALYFPLQ